MYSTPAKKQIKKIGAAKRVNKDARPAEVVPKVVSDEEYRCPCCGHKYAKQEGNFNVSKSPIFKGNNGYVVFCKKCIGQLYDQYVAFYDKDEDEALERICQLTDMYVDEDAWAASRKISTERAGKPRNRISTYVSKLNLMQSAGGTTYSDTLIRRWESQVENAESVKEVVENEDIETDPDVVRRFGVGFKAGEYDALQFEYSSWVEKLGEPEDKRQDELYVTMSLLKLNLQRAIQNESNGVGATANSYKSFIEAATTEIEDRKRKAEAEKEQKMKMDPVGVMIRDIENYTPSEFYKKKKLYKDEDSLVKYFNRVLVRPLRNILTGSNEADPEYNIDKMGDDDG